MGRKVINGFVYIYDKATGLVEYSNDPNIFGKEITIQDLEAA